MVYVIACSFPLPLATFTLPLLATEAQVWVFSKPRPPVPATFPAARKQNAQPASLPALSVL